MGKQIEKSGRTVDEAIFKGLQEIGLSIDEVEIEIVQKGSMGLLGIGAKPAIVRLTEKENEGLDIRGILEGDKKDDKKDESTRPAQDTKPKPQKPKEQTKTESEKAEQQQPEKESVEEQEEEPKEEIPYSEETAQNNEAAKFLAELLSKMGVEAKVLAAEVDDSLKLRIDTEAAGVLIGHRGETLDAIQYLTLLVANRDRSQKEYTRVSIDTQGYREKREEVLVRLAKSKASTVRATGKPYKFEPMSPYERRIIHSTLQGNSHVTTHSEGTEPYRYVVITATHTQKRRPQRHR